MCVLTLLGVLTILYTSVLPGSSQIGRIGIELDAVGEADAAHAGTNHRVALQARLDPGFHVNSNTPFDESLIPTILTLVPPDGITLDAVAWPEPVMLEQAGVDQPLEVFEEEFVIGATLALAHGLAAGEYIVPGTLQYQACDETMCYFPTTATLEFKLAIVPQSQPLTSMNAELFDGLLFKAAGGGKPNDVRGTPVSLASSLIPLADTEGTVLARLETFSTLGTAAGYLSSEDFLEFIDRSESGRAEQAGLEGLSPIAILSLILIGGLALNLTPCVLPMIPINLAVIGAGTGSGSRLRGFALGSVYGLAMALVYGILGLGVILTAGTFGTVNASPWFNLAIALLFVVLALAMFDVLTIDFSRLQSKFVSDNSRHGSFMVAFGMGGVAALLAGACVAPVVIQVIVFSSNLYATGTAVALVLPFILGLGMALPWPIAGAGLTLMPKPGPWMVRVKQAFGIFILGTAVYYGYLAYGLFSQRWVDPKAVTSGVQEMLEEGWYSSINQGLQVAEAENKLVLVDMWATWCKNCLTMDRTTLKDPDVQAVLDSYVKIKFQTEDPSVSPGKEVMAHFDALGLPTYAIIRLGGISNSQSLDPD